MVVIDPVVEYGDDDGRIARFDLPGLVEVDVGIDHRRSQEESAVVVVRPLPAIERVVGSQFDRAAGRGAAVVSLHELEKAGLLVVGQHLIEVDFGAGL
ncbi:MAG: hypothetical protein KDC43_24495 [Saprospiraceae bacterium]|nr:hypothetical protein [Saprospiraceae bacterium]